MVASPENGYEGRLIVAIDGPAGVGKSTVAKRLASRLGYRYLDTGALYRAVAWKVRQASVDPSDHSTVRALLGALTISVEQNPDAFRIAVDETDITQEIRTPEISEIASVVSAIPAVREWLLPVQHALGASGGIVVEGRDIGTKVFPRAQAKFFLDASSDIRARRRQRELIAAGQTASFDGTQAAIEARDRQDRTRPVSPLMAATDAMIIDTSALDPDQVVERMVAAIVSKQ